MTVNLDNTFVIRTDDKNFREAMNMFLAKYCDEEKVNVAFYDLNDTGAKKVWDIVTEK